LKIKADKSKILKWNMLFNKYIKRIKAYNKQLLKSQPYRISDNLPPNIPVKGIYLFSKKRKHLYVGRSNNIRQRMGMHTRPSSQNQATLAFRIAKKKLGIEPPTYKSKGSRPDLITNTIFKKAFDEAKREISKMEVRFLEETNPVMQALLEIYISITLPTQYNDFKTT
jgi:hypothetical protein